MYEILIANSCCDILFLARDIIQYTATNEHKHLVFDLSGIKSYSWRQLIDLADKTSLKIGVDGINIGSVTLPEYNMIFTRKIPEDEEEGIELLYELGDYKLSESSMKEMKIIKGGNTNE